MPEGRQGREGALGRDLVAAALAGLEANRERIDNLNVYPVPDGDTGTNMVLTVRAVRDALDEARPQTVAELAREITRSSLMGARGNSGVILSQIVRGVADALAEAQEIDARALASALRRGSEAAYAAVREPQEGTILTVARSLAERGEEVASEGASLVDALADVVVHGELALARTPEQLPLLREAGVVDAGGAGLLELVRSIAAHVRGEPLPEAPAESERLPLEAVHREPSRFRYCASFYVEGAEAEPEELERALCELGDSVLVVGSRGAVKAHVHTDEPGRALSLATAVGVVEEVDVRNMHAQTAARTERLLAATETGLSDVVAVCAGPGNARLFRSLGAAALVDGGRSMNPPTSDLLAAIEAVAAEEVLVLPNDPNVLLTAEQAAEAAEKDVFVVATRSLQAGLGAMVAFDATLSGEENAAEMEAAAALVRTGAVTRASRSTVVDGVRVAEGEFLGLVDRKPVASGPVLDAVARDVVERLLVESSDVLTILLGEGVADADELRDEIAAAHPELEIEVHDGGQPHYPLLVAVE